MTNSIVQASELRIENIGGELLIDSRLIADRLGIKHDSLFATIEKHYDRLSAKNQVRFEIEFRERAQGGKSKVRYALLDERQSTLLMTYSRNTEQVLDCKDALVDAFDRGDAPTPTASGMV
jgi:phage regulator Rha-like protein